MGPRRLSHGTTFPLPVGVPQGERTGVLLSSALDKHWENMTEGWAVALGEARGGQA